MKAVLMSIQPKWCKLIANGKKTVEVRKTRPKLETPFKVYIYETKAIDKNRLVVYVDSDELSQYYRGKGKVIGEFVCDEIYNYTASPVISEHIKSQCTISDEDMIKQSCMTLKDLYHYESYPESHNWGLLGWHISDFVIYDKPKELSEFYRLGKPLICDGRKCETCGHLKYMQVNSDEWDYDCDCHHQLENHITVTKPPQSWCYVEELR